MPPLADVPPLIVDLAQAIAIYKLHLAAPDPKIEDEFKAAMRALRDISTGVVRLPVAGVAPAATGGSGACTTDRERPFSADTLKGFV